ncbi:MAG: hypothetical protein VW236_07305 [Flavobacteriaceae bacterium]|jgi:hypothetical protein
MQALDYFQLALIVIGSAVAVFLIYKILKIILTPLRILVRFLLALAAFAALAYFVAQYFGYDLLAIVLGLLDQPNETLSV